MTDPAAPGPGFPGFPLGLGLLTSAGAQSKAQFQAGKSTWDGAITAPAQALVVAVGEALQARVSGGINAVPKTNGSLSPITRDLRFARDAGRPYKDHLLLNFWEGSPKRHAPTLRVRIAEEHTGFAAGAAFDADGLARWRAALCSDPARELIELLSRAGASHELQTTEPELKKPPSGFAAISEPAADLLRHKTFQARFVEPTPPLVTGPGFASWVVDRITELGELHRWLVRHTQPEDRR
ncbi:MAG: DUF2461 family protein [Acidimicrobiales bacterium]